jgi:hypothetical protein
MRSQRPGGEPAGGAQRAPLRRRRSSRPVNFTPALRLKDVEYALRWRASLGVPHAFGEGRGGLYRRLCAPGSRATTRAASSNVCGAGNSR